MNEAAPHGRHEGEGTARRAAEPPPGAVGAHARADLRTELSDSINVRTVGALVGARRRGNPAVASAAGR